jgi:hypothetical protein
MDQPATVAWQYVVRLIFPEDLPTAAAHLLAAGYDSPSLCDLAGPSRRAETAEIDELLDGAMDELGVPIPDEETAERCLLHHMATQLGAGAISPRDAAARITNYSCCDGRHPVFFTSAASGRDPMAPDICVRLVVPSFLIDNREHADHQAPSEAIDKRCP